MGYSNSLSSQILQINLCAGRRERRRTRRKRQRPNSILVPSFLPSSSSPSPSPPHQSFHLSSPLKSWTSSRARSSPPSSHLQLSSLYLFCAVNRANRVLQQKAKSIKVISFPFCFLFFCPLFFISEAAASASFPPPTCSQRE